MMNTTISAAPPFLFKLGVEENFPIVTAEQWMERNYHHCFYYLAAYLIVIFSVQYFMKSRKPFKLKKELAVWNAALAVVSFCAATRITHELFYVLRHFGFHYSVCNPSYLRETPVTSFWSYVCVAIKALELFDTMFIVLRKQKLLFLHWFHHGTMLIFTWMGIRDLSGSGRWPMGINFPVHAAMYSYFALRSLGIKIPRILAMSLTASQIVQMIVCTYVAFQIAYNWIFDLNCSNTGRMAFFGASLGIAYITLFMNFFYDSYLKPKPHLKIDSKCN